MGVAVSRGFSKKKLNSKTDVSEQSIWSEELNGELRGKKILSSPTTPF